MHTTTTSARDSLYILTIDDSSSERMVLNKKLQRMGHRVISVANGAEALAYLSKMLKKIDLILLDIRMPRLNGLETAQKIREMENRQSEAWRPIIFLSGLTDTQMIAQGIAAGGDDYLTKPVDSILLQAKITAMQRIAAMRNKLMISRKKLEVLAHTDELTQLPNRRHFMTILEKEMARARRQKTPLSIAYMDLDHFKQVNDKYGHETGDIVLKSVADILTKNLRTEDMIGRIGGEEFCMCFTGSDAENSLMPCERYRTLIKDLSIRIGTQTLVITASFGLTTFHPELDDAKRLLDRADEALYKAKRSGRNRIEVIQP